ncbi:hypothetical protein NEAUS06_0464 [Nematocida ausubeli]|nr:hypothetical protein NEAUS06_0464 [Nematocida ausubeli]
MFLPCVCLLLSVLLSYIGIVLHGIYSLARIQIDARDRLVTEKESHDKSERVVRQVLMYTAVIIIFIVSIKHSKSFLHMDPLNSICIYLLLNNRTHEYTPNILQTIQSNLFETTVIYAICRKKGLSTGMDLLLDLFISSYTVLEQVRSNGCNQEILTYKFNRSIFIHTVSYLVKRTCMHLLLNWDSAIFLRSIFMVEHRNMNESEYFYVLVLFLQELHFKRVLAFVMCK